jgi:predicted GNAT family acetyltransferase
MPSELPASAVAIAIRDNRARGRYELRIDGEPTGWLEYRHTRVYMIVAHTEIAEQQRGQGLGPLLVRRALQDARHAGKPVVPTCAFARAYLARHPELDEYLAPHLRRAG